MEKNNATIYTPAKNNIGCNAPIAEMDFLFIGFDLDFNIYRMLFYTFKNLFSGKKQF